MSNIYQKWKGTTLFMVAVVGMILSGCQEDLLVPTQVIDEDAATQARAIYSSREVYFSQSNGGFSSSDASSAFGNISGWDAGSTYISSNTLRISLAANVVGTSGGMESRIDVSDGTEYWLEYKVRFHSAFDWSRGGKVGWGFQVGDGVTGCRASDAQSGKGGSMRAMWYSPNSSDSRVYFQPYLYHQGMTSNCGESFGATYPSSGALSRGTWYTIGFYMKSNTGSSYNGTAEMKVNGSTVLRRDNIKWASSDSKRKVKGLYYSVFRGGSQSYWGSSSVGYIYFDDLKWNKMSS
ncbi:MAG: hypothetical protein RIC35_15550 [Marinoscillum sp.]